MSDTVILDGELSLTNQLDGEAGTVIEVGHDTGIDTIVFNSDYTLTFNMTNGETFTNVKKRYDRKQDHDCEDRSAKGGSILSQDPVRTVHHGGRQK